MSVYADKEDSGVHGNNVFFVYISGGIATTFVHTNDQSFEVFYSSCAQVSACTISYLTSTLTHHIGMLPTNSVGKNWLQYILNQLQSNIL
jgi:hypothetical protein